MVIIMARVEIHGNQAWIGSPLPTAVGGLELAGILEDSAGIDPKAMRVLGSYGLVYVLAADGYYADANGVRRDFRDGDVILIAPELAHAYGPKNGGSWTHIYFVFSGPQFDLWRKAGLLDPGRPIWRAEPVDFWARRLQETVSPDEGHGPGASLRTLGRFLEMLAALVALRDTEVPDAAGTVWIEESQALLGSSDGGGWLAPQVVAKRVGLSYENFRKQFAARTGMSPGHFQKRKRIERAQSAIYHGDRTLKQLAEELEFCDVFHFSKAFKRIAGLSPSDFRRKVRGG
jgi:AraC-like DNA-binding protein